MSATIVVGGQYGSEGKGKVVALLAKASHSPWLVRCGGPNSGHSVTIEGKSVVLRQVPSCSEPEKATFCVAAGCVVDEEILLRELDLLKIPQDRIIVDPRSVLVTEGDRVAEADTLVRIGSTCSGTGAALLRRMSRAYGVRLSKDSAAIRARCRVETVATLLHRQIEDGGDVIVEGTQGFALSLLHGPDYPYVTSRDTTAAAFAMEVGLSPRQIDNIVMVVRTFPIRVAGTSGPFANEFSWEHVRNISGAPKVLPEYTSVTQRLRRVARFDLDLVKLATKYNCPTSLAVMGLDRLEYANTGIADWNKLTPLANKFLNVLELATGVPVAFAGTGFGTFDVAAKHTIAFNL
ncbi:MAG TPA: adenylosuccinate synthetase [Candidatus Saccharimonadales bacterium]|nr:adenylosuccinate synthetase [Candidatus Saccharimonadales bacterium]